MSPVGRWHGVDRGVLMRHSCQSFLHAADDAKHTVELGSVESVENVGVRAGNDEAAVMLPGLAVKLEEEAYAGRGDDGDAREVEDEAPAGFLGEEDQL